MKRDIEVTKQFESEGWIVLRFWGKQIKKDLEGCIDIIQDAIRRVQINKM